MAEWTAELAGIVRQYGWERRGEAFELSSGGMSFDYIDGKRALADGMHLAMAARAVIETVGEPFDAVGGMTMGADHLSHAVAVLSGTRWFSVRKEPKTHGTRSQLEGAVLSEGDRIVLVDDAVTTGRSILLALAAITGIGVEVVCAVPLVDRGDTAGPAFAERGIRWSPLLTYVDLGIDPV